MNLLKVEINKVNALIFKIFGFQNIEPDQSGLPLSSLFGLIPHLLFFSIIILKFCDKK